MRYKIIINKTEVGIDEDDKKKIIENIDKNFIILKSGEVINPSFVQGIFIDIEATKQEKKYLKFENNKLLKGPEVERIVIPEDIKKSIENIIGSKKIK